jgi:hypothetical protein
LKGASIFEATGAVAKNWLELKIEPPLIGKFSLPKSAKHSAAKKLICAKERKKVW